MSVVLFVIAAMLGCIGYWWIRAPRGHEPRPGEDFEPPDDRCAFA